MEEFRDKRDWILNIGRREATAAKLRRMGQEQQALSLEMFKEISQVIGPEA